jgi:O-antigen biosynthesis protein
MKIAFLLGTPDICGGTYVIFEHATRLQRLGNPVTMVTEEAVDASRYGWHPAACQLAWQTYQDLAGQRFDLTIATWWQSVYQLARIPSRRYLYFIQSIESRFFEAGDSDDPGLRDIEILRQWCENTYRICLPVITEARWIQKYLVDHHNRPSFLVRNGIRKDIYTENGPVVKQRRLGQLRVLVEGPLGVFFKNVERTIALCRRAEVEEVWLLTSSAVAAHPGVDRCFSRIPIEQTAEIYRSCDVLVKLSYVEGMFGPPLEMFHCGGTAIVYDVTGHDEYIRHGENSLVVRRDDEAAVVAALTRLKTEPDLLATLQAGARMTAQAWPDWEVAAGEFYRALAACDQQYPDMTSIFLAENSAFLLATRDDGLRARELSRMMAREQLGGDPAAAVVNHIQVYWDCGRGMEPVLTDRYRSGCWSRCRVVVPCPLPPKVLRVDPSVSMGVVEIRSLRVSGARSGALFGQWREGGSWDDIGVAGTAHLLRTSPYPILEAYGEDPQLFLPPLVNLPAGEKIEIEIELREWSFAQALTFFGRGELQPAPHGFTRIKRFLARLRGRAGRLRSRLAGGRRRQT